MPRKLTVAKETLAELTSDQMSAVVGAAESNSCTIANVCITNAVRQAAINLDLGC